MCINFLFIITKKNLSFQLNIMYNEKLARELAIDHNKLCDNSRDLNCGYKSLRRFENWPMNFFTYLKPTRCVEVAI